MDYFWVVIAVLCAPVLYAFTIALSGAARENKDGLLVAIPVVIAIIIFAILMAP